MSALKLQEKRGCLEFFCCWLDFWMTVCILFFFRWMTTIHNLHFLVQSNSFVQHRSAKWTAHILAENHASYECNVICQSREKPEDSSSELCCRILHHTLSNYVPDLLSRNVFSFLRSWRYCLLRSTAEYWRSLSWLRRILCLQFPECGWNYLLEACCLWPLVLDRDQLRECFLARYHVWDKQPTWLELGIWRQL